MSARWDAAEALDVYFLETRAKLLEIAATLDRIERMPDAEKVKSDSRMVFMREALTVLAGPGPGRAERIQRLYSKE